MQNDYLFRSRPSRCEVTIQKLAFRHFGGAKKQAEQISNTPVPPPIPPVSSSASDVQAVGRQTMIKQAKRKGGASTLLAGETGAAVGNTGFGGKTLLGAEA